MRNHPDDFRAFLPSVNGEDSAGATTHDGIVTDKEYEQYCHNVEHTGEWGGELEVRYTSMNPFLAQTGFTRLSSRLTRGSGSIVARIARASSLLSLTQAEMYITEG